jgi:tryptophanyl-tRNA synthetase
LRCWRSSSGSPTGAISWGGYVGNRLDQGLAAAITGAAIVAHRGQMNRIFSGIQPTGNLHLGNYLGAIRNWVVLQKDYECIFCIVDLHALTLPQDPAELRASTREVTAAYIASGIDPERCTIFNQSMVPAHTELAWLLGCLTPLGWLNRMTQFKERTAGKNREMAGLGLYAYPVLMAADILLYKATHVPVGEDQKQHLELARDLAGAFNRRYERDFFPLPEPQIFGTATRVMSLRDGTKKMSKSDTSDYSRINMTDDADTIALKVRRAKTDPEPLPVVITELERRPEADNLIGIYGALSGLSREDALARFAGQNFSRFKEALSELAVEVLGRIGGEMRRLMADPGYIDSVLRRGAEHAKTIAGPVLREAQEISGLLRP